MEIRAAVVADLPAISELLADAFTLDPIAYYPFGPETAHERLRRFFGRFDLRFVEHGWLWTIDDAQAIAAWIPPGGRDRYLEATVEASAELEPLSADERPRWEAFWDWIDNQRPVGPHWYLEHVAVAEGLRGRGIGKVLVQFGCDAADRSGDPAFLVTSKERNVRFYERFGFRVMDVAAGPPGVPDMWFMLREARTWPALG